MSDSHFPDVSLSVRLEMIEAEHESLVEICKRQTARLQKQENDLSALKEIADRLIRCVSDLTQLYKSTAAGQVPDILSAEVGSHDPIQ